MATLDRVLARVYPPVYYDVLDPIVRAVGNGYPKQRVIIGVQADDPDLPITVVIREEVDDTDPRLIDGRHDRPAILG